MNIVPSGQLELQIKCPCETPFKSHEFYHFKSPSPVTKRKTTFGGEVNIRMSECYSGLSRGFPVPVSLPCVPHRYGKSQVKSR